MPPAQAASVSSDATAEKAPAPGERRAPLAVIVDEESSLRHFVSLILQGRGIDTIEFADGAAFRQAKFSQAPALVFLNVSLEVQDAMQSIETLSKSGLGAAVQLMSNRGSAVLDTVRQIGEQFKMRMLPVLKKPFETSAIMSIVSEMKLGDAHAATEVKLSLAEALKNSWVEFWYQPKVDLRQKQLAGAEAFARVRHPQHGVLTPGSFMPGADDASVIKLAEQALVSALLSGLNLAKFGVNLRIAVNVPVKALVKLPVEEIVRTHRPNVTDWPGLIIDVPEQQIVNEIALANELNKKFAEHQVRLAIDDFGKAHIALMKLKELPFAEMKLDRSYVAGCGTDKVHAPICKTVIDLAHSFGALAVGIGLERAADAVALVRMGCDVGQGFLFGQPMPEERFIALLKQRVMVRAPEAPATVSEAAPATDAAETPALAPA
jgi:EAL domain-containing protein (putative c-di-GMP-specific phosphodiesterase class I)/FixJ family two-component response regulator